MHTIIRDENTTRDDLIFYSQRLFRLLIEEAMNEFVYTDKEVTTPIGQSYHGLGLAHPVCGVSIIRAGETLENALQYIQKDVAIGKILIQTDIETGEPQV